ncbi:hypothetical protein ACQR1I_35370 [Bradyrhizobium sp. HKCCYLS2038]|uniref:hypothetical protein n=1 Tax=unclassified Bradyrhizobium TaxID=2631580 RepID=UPI003EBBA7A9
MSSSTISTDNDDFVWGAKSIGKMIGRTEKGAFHALESGRVPGARKVAGRWGLHVPTFREHFRQPADVAA